MIVYIIGPGRYFSLFARHVIWAGAIPVGGPLVAALSESESQSLRYKLLDLADVIFLMPGWRDEKTSLDEYVQAGLGWKPATDKLSQLLTYVSEEVTEDQFIMEPAPIVPVGQATQTRLM